MPTSDSTGIQMAYEAAAHDDIEPLVALLDPSLDWRGVERGLLWWRKAPG